MNKFLKNITLVLLLIFSSNTIFCMQDQVACKKASNEHTYPNLNIDGLPQEALINIVLQLLKEGETVKDSLDNVKNFFLTNKSINSELKEYFWNNIHKELFEIYYIIIEEVKNTILIGEFEQGSTKRTLSKLDKEAKTTQSLLFKIFAKKIITDLLIFDLTNSNSCIIDFIIYYKDITLLDLLLQNIESFLKLPNLEKKGADSSIALSNTLIIAFKFNNKKAIKLLVEKYKTKIKAEHILESIERENDLETFNYLFRNSIFSKDIDELKKLLTFRNGLIFKIALNHSLDIFKELLKIVRSLDIDISEKQNLLNLEKSEEEDEEEGLMSFAIKTNESADKIEKIQFILDNSDLIKLTKKDLRTAIDTEDKDLIKLLLNNGSIQAEYDHNNFLDYCQIDAESKATFAKAEQLKLLAAKKHATYLELSKADSDEKIDYIFEEEKEPSRENPRVVVCTIM